MCACVACLCVRMRALGAGLVEEGSGRWLLLKVALPGALCFVFLGQLCPALGAVNSSYICRAWAEQFAGWGEEQLADPPAGGSGCPQLLGVRGRGAGGP